MDPGAHFEPAPSRTVGLLDALASPDESARGKVRTGQKLQKLVDLAIGIGDQMIGGLEKLARVVRRDLGGHADRDPVGPVEEEVRESRGQDRGLGQTAVEIGPHVDRVTVDVVQQVDRDRRQPHLGVTVRGRRVAVDRAEVSLTVDEWVAEREILHHPHDRVVDGAVAMRVIPTEDIAHDRSALLVRPPRLQSFLAHGEQDAAVHRFEPVTGVGKSALNDHAHRIVDERVPHLLLDEPDLDPFPLNGGLRHLATPP